MRRAALVLAGLVLFARPAWAHKGPPYPLLMDVPGGPDILPGCADPDVGLGTFYLLFKAPAGRPFPPLQSVRIVVAPLSGRLPESPLPSRTVMPSASGA